MRTPIKLIEYCKETKYENLAVASLVTKFVRNNERRLFSILLKFLCVKTLCDHRYRIHLYTVRDIVGNNAVFHHILTDGLQIYKIALSDYTINDSNEKFVQKLNIFLSSHGELPL